MHLLPIIFLIPISYANPSAHTATFASTMKESTNPIFFLCISSQYLSLTVSYHRINTTQSNLFVPCSIKIYFNSSNWGWLPFLITISSKRLFFLLSLVELIDVLLDELHSFLHLPASLSKVLPIPIIPGCLHLLLLFCI